MSIPKQMESSKSEEIFFYAYEPLLKPLSGAQGGGFRLSIDISEDQYDSVKDLLDPSLKNSTLKVRITQEPM